MDCQKPMDEIRFPQKCLVMLLYTKLFSFSVGLCIYDTRFNVLQTFKPFTDPVTDEIKVRLLLRFKF